MRIISQDGRTDIPYEYVIIGISERSECVICAYPLTTFAEIPHLKLAEYSTANKALKVMEMLYQAYIGTFIAINAEIPNGEYEKLKEMMKHGYGTLAVRSDEDKKAEFKPLNIFFQFPQDSEVEE